MGLVAAAGARCAASPRAAGHGPPLAPRDPMHVRLGPALIAFLQDSFSSPAFERAAACRLPLGMRVFHPKAYVSMCQSYEANKFLRISVRAVCWYHTSQCAGHLPHTDTHKLCAHEWSNSSG